MQETQHLRQHQGRCHRSDKRLAHRGSPEHRHPTPTGIVTFLEGKSVLGSVALLDGKARLTTSLPVGKHLLRVVYGGTVHSAKSASPKMLESIVQHQSTKPLAPQLTALPSDGSGHILQGPLLRRHAVKRSATETGSIAQAGLEP